MKGLGVIYNSQISSANKTRKLYIYDGIDMKSITLNFKIWSPYISDKKLTALNFEDGINLKRYLAKADQIKEDEDLKYYLKERSIKELVYGLNSIQIFYIDEDKLPEGDVNISDIISPVDRDYLSPRKRVINSLRENSYIKCVEINPISINFMESFSVIKRPVCVKYNTYYMPVTKTFKEDKSVSNIYIKPFSKENAIWVGNCYPNIKHSDDYIKGEIYLPLDSSGIRYERKNKKETVFLMKDLKEEQEQEISIKFKKENLSKYDMSDNIMFMNFPSGAWRT